MESLFIMVGIIILVAAMYFEQRQGGEKQGFSYLAEQEQKVHTLSLAVDKAKRDVTALLAELEKTGEQVVKDCEQSIAQLQALKHTEVAEPSVADIATNQASELKRSSSKSRAKANPAKTKAAATTSVSGKDNKYSTILALAETGKTVEEIAQTVKVGKGEVALILGLRGKGDLE